MSDRKLVAIIVACLAVAALLTFSGCATWDEIARVSIISLEKSHAEAATAAREYNAKRMDDFKARAAKAKTIAEVDAGEAELAAYEAKMRKVVDGFNKSWAFIAQIKVGYPILKRVTDPAERKKVDGFIVDALAFLLQGKDTLSAFGVQIGGGAP